MIWKKIVIIFLLYPFILSAQNEKWVFMGYWSYENIQGECSKKADYGLIKIRKNSNYTKNLSAIKNRLKENFTSLSGITYYETTSSQGGVYKIYKINSWCNENSKRYEWTGFHVMSGESNVIDRKFQNYVDNISNIKNTQTYITGFLDLEINNAQNEVFAIQGISMNGIGDNLNSSDVNSNVELEEDLIEEFPNQSPELNNEELFIVDERDGNKYKIITFSYNGETISWMAENLRFDIKGAYDTPENNNRGGKFYDWNAAINSCPNGWRLPNDEDWDNLINRFSGYEGNSAKFRSKNGWLDNNGTNETGFDVQPIGTFQVKLDEVLGSGEFSDFWSSTIVFERNASVRRFFYKNPNVIIANAKRSDFSYGGVPRKSAKCVRCVKIE